MGDLSLGVDIGTSSTKGVLSRPDSEVVVTAQSPHGLSTSHGPLCRAALDATVYGLSRIFEFMREAGGGGEWLIAVGGTKDGLWRQIASGMMRRTQDLREQTIGAAYGGALLAACAVGLAEPDNDWSTISYKVTPIAENRGVYGELYGIYRRLYPATREQSHKKLAQMQKGEGDVVA